MPTYSYICDACGHRFDQFQTIVEEHIRICPICGKERVRRLIVVVAGLIFKGSGFYITDYARSNVSGPDGSKTGDSQKEKVDKPEKKQEKYNGASEGTATRKTSDK